MSLFRFHSPLSLNSSGCHTLLPIHFCVSFVWLPYFALHSHYVSFVWMSDFALHSLLCLFRHDIIFALHSLLSLLHQVFILCSPFTLVSLSSSCHTLFSFPRCVSFVSMSDFALHSLLSILNLLIILCSPFSLCLFLLSYFAFHSLSQVRYTQSCNEVWQMWYKVKITRIRRKNDD